MQLNKSDQAKNILYPPVVSLERYRAWVALILLALYGGWLLFGLIWLIWKQNPWILVSSVLLMYPVYLIIHYYFGGKRE